MGRLTAGLLAAGLVACGGESVDPDRAMSGGGSTVALATGAAYEAPSPLLDRTAERDFFKGRFATLV